MDNIDGHFEFEVIRYLVLKKMAGDELLLRATYDYMVHDLNIRDLADLYGYSRTVIRATKQRIIEKSGGDRRLAKEIVARTTREIIRHVPRYGVGRLYGLCTLCRMYIDNDHIVDHFDKYHSDLINAYARMILEMLRRNDKNAKVVRQT